MSKGARYLSTEHGSCAMWSVYTHTSCGHSDTLHASVVPSPRMPAVSFQMTPTSGVSITMSSSSSYTLVPTDTLRSIESAVNRLDEQLAPSLVDSL